MQPAVHGSDRGEGLGRVGELSMLRVVSVNLGWREALLSDGRVVPVTNMLNADGEDTEDVAEAVGFVSGAGSEWFVDLVSDFEGASIQ